MIDNANSSPIEKQYSDHFIKKSQGINDVMGVMSVARWHSDPKLLAVTLSRYKFVSKMFQNFESVLEVGAGDCWASRIVLQTVKKLTLSDFDPIFEAEFYERKYNKDTGCEFIIHNFVSNKLSQVYDGIYALDVLEHIAPSDSEKFLSNICGSMSLSGAAIFGMPSLESQKYASEGSKQGHVNCQTGTELYTNLKVHFNNVFIFSMSDEVVHTGFLPMSHYLLALCVGPLKGRLDNP